MTPSPYEFSRLVRVDQITAAAITITASAEECHDLAKRFGLEALQLLTATIRLERRGRDQVRASGRIAAKLTQTCVVTLEPADSTIDEEFAVTYDAGAQVDSDLDPAAEDVLVLPPDVIDIGELAAQQLGLSIDPYPRAPGATLPELAADQPARAFSALRQVKLRR